MSHQFAHAVLAQHDSPFNSALIVSYDGGGDDGCFHAFVSRSRTERPSPVLASSVCPGTVYGVLASLVADVSRSRSCLEFNQWSSEGHFLALPGKLMAYASLGTVQPVLLELVSTFFETWHREHYYQLCGMHAAALREIIGEAMRNTSGRGTPASALLDGRAPEESEPHALQKLLVGGEAGANLAATIQAAFERLAGSTVQHLLRMHRRTVDGIVLVGGCALNVRANQRVSDLAAESGLSVYVPAAPNDAGIVVGAIWALSPPPVPAVHVGRPQRLQYSGPYVFDRHELPAAAARRGALPVHLNVVAGWLGHGHVIGMVRGRTEWGPRALGHRSLLG